eukprot:3118975-Pleurochrysis_carterae.AAC.6
MKQLQGCVVCWRSLAQEPLSIKEVAVGTVLLAFAASANFITAAYTAAVIPTASRRSCEVGDQPGARRQRWYRHNAGASKPYAAFNGQHLWVRIVRTACWSLWPGHLRRCCEAQAQPGVAIQF